MSEGRSPHRRRLLFVVVLLTGLTLACGSFSARPGSEPTPWPTATARPPTATATPRPPTPTVTPVPPTPTPPPPTPTLSPNKMAPGQPARVVARTGVNIRQDPTTKGRLLGRFGAGVLVQVLQGPVQADGFTWWRLDDQHGKVGWAADGDSRDRWLDGNLGEARPVNRAVRLGDTVAVTVRPGLVLAIRFQPGRDALVSRRLTTGAQLRIAEGPVDVEGLRWWKVTGEGGISGWAAEADAEERWLSPIE